MRLGLLAALCLSMTSFAAEPHLRTSIGTWSSYGAEGSSISTLGILGMSVQLGSQLDDRYAVYLQGQASYAVVAYAFSLGALAEVSPVRWLSLAGGAGVAGGLVMDASHPAVAFGLPVRIAFNFGPSDSPHAFYAALDGFLGKPVERDSRAGFAWSAGVSLGWLMR